MTLTIRSPCWAAARSVPRWSGCCTIRPTTSPRGSARRWSWSASRSAGPAGDRGDLPVDPGLFTTDALGLVKRDDVDVVVEVVGGIEPARTWLIEALRGGKSVVTANKALLAEDGATLHDAAAEGGADLYYEASVAGAIPLLRPLRESLHGDRITQVTGIVNGTTNYILSSMDATGAGFQEALGRGDRAGLRGGRPDRRCGGLRRRGQGRHPRLARVPHPGHRGRRLPRGHHRGDRRRHGQRQGDGLHDQAALHRRPWPGRDRRRSVSVRVHPAMIPRSHPLASVGDAFNAVFVEAEAAGQLMFYGRGAGGAPTASAVLGDLVAVARNRLAGTRARQRIGLRRSADPADRRGGHPLPHQPGRGRPAGVLATVAGVFAKHEVSIATVRQSGRDADASW